MCVENKNYSLGGGVVQEETFILLGWLVGCWVLVVTMPAASPTCIVIDVIEKKKKKKK